MNNNKSESVLKYFFNATILKVDSDGNILCTVFNSKEDFNPPKKSNIIELFSVSDRIRAERLLVSGTEDTKKFMQLASKFNIKEYADVEVHVEEGEIYVALKFFESNREKELRSDRRMEKFAEMAELDPLTNLLNRYGYWERVKSLLNCGDSDRRLGIIMVDIDNLKGINDKKGHKQGDKAISEISEFIADSLRKRDVAVRYGGDEFVIVVEELSGSRSSAVGLGKRLVREIDADQKRFLTTVSVGVHIVKVGDFEAYLQNENQLRKSWDKAVEVADEMAYTAKQDGKNRLVFSADKKI